jgi:hypothetical protein
MFERIYKEAYKIASDTPNNIMYFEPLIFPNVMEIDVFGVHIDSVV